MYIVIFRKDIDNVLNLTITVKIQFLHGGNLSNRSLLQGRHEKICRVCNLLHQEYDANSKDL